LETTPNIKAPRPNGSAALDHIPADVDRIIEKAHTPVNAVAAAVHDAIDHAAEIAPTLAANQRKLFNDACRYVSAHPMKAVGIALAAGLLISRILK
jgi:ElaB/YqjD/DUF883 family membrane-anchored ribosome-binding protein